MHLNVVTDMKVYKFATYIPTEMQDQLRFVDSFYCFGDYNSISRGLVYSRLNAEYNRKAIHVVHLNRVKLFHEETKGN